MKIAFKGNKILTLGGKTFSLVEGPITIYNVTCEDDGHGSIIATPSSGRKDTLITLSNTPDAQYRLNKYTLDGNDLQGNTFNIQNDCIVKGWFERYIFNISVTQPQNGTVNTNKNSAEAGETVTLSCTPDSGYEFKYFTVNGVQIVGNTFTMPASNVTVSASIDVAPPSFDSVQIGNQIWMSKNLAIDDGGEGISTVTVNYGQGDVVEYHYTWDAAVRVASSVQGWHLPTRDELSTLASYVGSSPGTKLKSTYGWEHNYYYGNGTDEFHFTGLPAGDYYEGTYYRFGKNARFWSSSSLNNGFAYYRVLAYDDDYFSDGSGEKTNGCSVRLIKDS